MTDDAAVADDDEECEDLRSKGAPGLAMAALAGGVGAAAGYYAGGACLATLASAEQASTAEGPQPHSPSR